MLLAIRPASDTLLAINLATAASHMLLAIRPMTDPSDMLLAISFLLAISLATEAEVLPPHAANTSR